MFNFERPGERPMPSPKPPKPPKQTEKHNDQRLHDIWLQVYVSVLNNKGRRIDAERAAISALEDYENYFYNFLER